MTTQIKFIAILIVVFTIANSPMAWAKNHPAPKSQNQQYRPIDGLDDSKPLPGPPGMMRQILDIMEYDGSIQDLTPPPEKTK